MDGAAGEEAKMSNWRQRRAAAIAQRDQAESDRREIWRIALHESSHAVAVHLLGAEVEKVAVGRGVLDDSLSLSGGCFWRMRGGEKIPPSIMLRVALAGGAADTFFCGRQEDMYGGDGRAAWAAAAEIAEATGQDACDISRAARMEAQGLVARHAEAIKTLAAALLEARLHELPGGRVEDILRRAGVQRGGLAPGRAPQPGRELYFERRDGRTVVTRDPDPRRMTSVTMHRADGYIR